MVNSFQQKAKELEKEYNINYYEALQKFMFERILERISISKYKDNFILKGGLLLSAIFGVDNRTTKDMDTTIKAIDNTFANREAFHYLHDYEQIINSIMEDERTNNLWNIYCKKNYYARNININQVLLLLKTL